MKQLTPYPWEDVDKRYQVTQRVKGKVVSITDYGARGAGEGNRGTHPHLRDVLDAACSPSVQGGRDR